MKIIIFDGDCLVCNKFINFINKNDFENQIYFCSLNSQYAINLLDQYKYKGTLNSIIYINEMKIHAKFGAIKSILTTLNGWFKLFNLMHIIPLPIGDFLYDKFANNRLIFGTNENMCSYNPGLLKQILK